MKNRTETLKLIAYAQSAATVRKYLPAVREGVVAITEEWLLTLAGLADNALRELHDDESGCK